MSNKSLYKINYSIKNKSHKRGNTQTLTNLTKADVKDWTNWLEFKRLYYNIKVQ